MKALVSSVSASLTLSLLLVAGANASDFRWPNNVEAAVSLSYDDTLDSQLDNAIPALDRYGLKGSFYLIMDTPVLTERLDEWRAAAANGHELGNHTLFHPCSRSEPGRDWVDPDNDLDQRSVQQMRKEVEVASAFLYAIDGETERTFTPPCTDQQAADGNYVEAVQDLFIGIKSFPASYPRANFATYLVPENITGEELITFVERAADEYALVNIIFHGIGGDHLSVSTDAHDQLLQYLSVTDDIYWTDTYRNIMRYVNEQQPGD
ncbi:polysaccharide deacetylase family protein [Marinimicrobium alkaliphilum]|uniref:polysaccharide deacetylase family protein n=1 Tax=Marinimicrobium alkaliphilum TaxID=2202654 RepID=UPI000DB94202|nr:polysaccharide deacetylase family protein [Marinimicrobium alkaliphilum]